MRTIVIMQCAFGSNKKEKEKKTKIPNDFLWKKHFENEVFRHILTFSIEL